MVGAEALATEPVELEALGLAATTLVFVEDWLVVVPGAKTDARDLDVEATERF